MDLLEYLENHRDGLFEDSKEDPRHRRIKNAILSNPRKIKIFRRPVRSFQEVEFMGVYGEKRRVDAVFVAGDYPEYILYGVEVKSTNKDSSASEAREILQAFYSFFIKFGYPIRMKRVFGTETDGIGYRNVREKPSEVYGRIDELLGEL